MKNIYASAKVYDKAIAELKIRNRKIYDLCESEDFVSYALIGKQFGISRQRAKQVHRAEALKIAQQEKK